MKLSNKDKEEIAELVVQKLKKKKERKRKEIKLNRYMFAFITAIFFIGVMLSINFLNPAWQLNILNQAKAYNIQAFGIIATTFAILDIAYIMMAKKFTYDIAFPWIRMDTAGMKIRFARMIKKIDGNTYIVKNRLLPLFKFYRFHSNEYELQESIYAIDVKCPNIVLHNSEFYATDKFDEFVKEVADIYNPKVMNEITDIGEVVMHGVKGDFGLQKRKFNQGIPYQIIKKNKDE